MNDQEYTKHYYIEGERICSKIGSGFGVAPYDPLGGPVDVLSGDFSELPGQMLTMVRRSAVCTGYEGDITICEELKPAHNSASDPENDQYFYHPDHLGSSSYITDLYGNGIQHLQYLPLGETFVDQQTGQWNTPYKFSGKEKDDETGYSYFGARYYDSDLSVWLSVDPMAGERSWVSPYSYCQDNPIARVDPTGALDWKPDKDGNLIAEKGDNAITLSKYSGISYEDANRTFSNLKNWDAKQNTSGIVDVEGHTLTISDKSLKIGNIAEYYANNGSTAWNYEVENGKYPADKNKCNVFCYDVTTQAGASPGEPNVINPGWSKLPFIKKKYGAPFAGQWADPSYSIPNWKVLGPKDTPKRGDVAAYQFSYSDASGHVAIVVSPGFTVGTSGTYNKIAKTRFGFDPALSHGQPIIYRRYVGK